MAPGTADRDAIGPVRSRRSAPLGESSLDLYRLTLHELRDLIQRGEVSPVQVVQSYLARIDAVEERVQAFNGVTADGLERGREVPAVQGKKALSRPWRASPWPSRTSSAPGACRRRARRGSWNTSSRPTTPPWWTACNAAGAVVLGQDQHGRVRHGLVHRELGVQGDAEPLGPGVRPRRLQRRLRGRRGGGHVRRAPWAPTRAAPSASRRLSAASPHSSPPTDACRATASSPSPRRWIRSALWPRTCGTPRSCSG